MLHKYPIFRYSHKEVEYWFLTNTKISKSLQKSPNNYNTLCAILYVWIHAPPCAQPLEPGHATALGYRKSYQQQEIKEWKPWQPKCSMNRMLQTGIFWVTQGGIVHRGCQYNTVFINQWPLQPDHLSMARHWACQDKRVGHSLRTTMLTRTHTHPYIHRGVHKHTYTIELHCI